MNCRNDGPALRRTVAMRRAERDSVLASAYRVERFFLLAFLLVFFLPELFFLRDACFAWRDSARCLAACRPSRCSACLAACDRLAEVFFPPLLRVGDFLRPPLAAIVFFLAAFPFGGTSPQASRPFQRPL